MSQPTPYNVTTSFEEDEIANAGGRSTVRTPNLDTEFDNIELTLDQVLTNLALLQRDDGKLVDALVEYWNLSASAKAALLATKWNARGIWATAQTYALNDMVDFSGAAYICAVGHVSGTFATDYAAGKWQIFTSANTASATTFTPTANVLSSNVQAAIAEVDTNSRGRDMAALSAFYGGM